MQALSLLDSVDAEEIIKLRVDLARTKSKLAKYEELFPKIDQFQTHLASLYQLFNHQEASLYDISSLLGLQMQPQKLVWREVTSKNKWENGQYVQEMIFRGEEIVRALGQEGNLLTGLSRAVEETVKHAKASKESYRELEREYAVSTGKLASLQKQVEMMRLMEVQIKQKQVKIMELKRSREQLSDQMGEKDRIKEDLEAKVRELVMEIEEKNRQIFALQEKGSEGEMVIAEKEEVLDRCKQLMESLEVGEEEYLSHYFRTNGMPLDVQRPTKNKYEMVFD